MSDEKPIEDARDPDEAWLGLLEIALQVPREPAHRPDPRSHRPRDHARPATGTTPSA